MPKTGGVMPRKILPIFAVMQSFGDDRDNIYRSILNGLLEKYCITNENNADVEAKLYFAQYDSESFVETNGLIKMAENIDDIELKTANVATYTPNDILSYIVGKMSTSEYLLSDVGFYQPIIYLFLGDIECDTGVISALTENRWFKYATRLGLPFDNADEISEESLIQLTGNPEAIFRIPVMPSNEKVREIIDLIYGIRIDSITHSIMVEAAYPQTGMTGAGHFLTHNSLTARQANFADIVSVDPVAENESVEGEPIALAGTLAISEKQAMDEEPVETTDREKNTDSNTDDEASGSWED